MRKAPARRSSSPRGSCASASSGSASRPGSRTDAAQAPGAMDSRTAAHALSRIAAYLELKGENAFKIRAYSGAARGLLALGADDLAPLLASGELAAVRGLGPATL